jgi:hypothetical protein
MGAGQFDEARLALQTAVSRLNDETRPFFEQFGKHLEDQIYSYETAASGEDLVGLMAEIQDQVPMIEDEALLQKPARDLTAADLNTISGLVNSVAFWNRLDAAAEWRGRAQLYPIGQEGTPVQAIASMPTPDFRKMQMLARLCVLRGHLARSQDNIDESVRRYGAVIHMGQSMRHGDLLSRLIGIALEFIGMDALDQLLQDGLIHGTPHFAAYQQCLAFLLEEEPHIQAYDMMSTEFGTFGPMAADPMLEWILTSVAMVNFEAAISRANLITTRMRLHEEALDFMIEYPKGAYPASLPGDAIELEDPFAPGQKLLYRSDGDQASFYSLGPDGLSQMGRFVYDPTNGTDSPGDIVLTIK